MKSKSGKMAKAGMRVKAGTRIKDGYKHIVYHSSNLWYKLDEFPELKCFVQDAIALGEMARLNGDKNLLAQALFVLLTRVINAASAITRTSRVFEDSFPIEWYRDRRTNVVAWMFANLCEVPTPDMLDIPISTFVSQEHKSANLSSATEASQVEATTETVTEAATAKAVTAEAKTAKEEYAACVFESSECEIKTCEDACNPTDKDELCRITICIRSSENVNIYWSCSRVSLLQKQIGLNSLPWIRRVIASINECKRNLATLVSTRWQYENMMVSNLGNLTPPLIENNLILIVHESIVTIKEYGVYGNATYSVVVTRDQFMKILDGFASVLQSELDGE